MQLPRDGLWESVDRSDPSCRRLDHLWRCIEEGVIEHPRRVIAQARRSASYSGMGRGLRVTVFVYRPPCRDSSWRPGSCSLAEGGPAQSWTAFLQRMILRWRLSGVMLARSFPPFRSRRALDFLELDDILPCHEARETFVVLVLVHRILDPPQWVFDPIILRGVKEGTLDVALGCFYSDSVLRSRFRPDKN